METSSLEWPLTFLRAFGWDVSTLTNNNNDNEYDPFNNSNGSNPFLYTPPHSTNPIHVLQSSPSRARFQPNRPIIEWIELFPPLTAWNELLMTKLDALSRRLAKVEVNMSSKVDKDIAEGIHREVRELNGFVSKVFENHQTRIEQLHQHHVVSQDNTLNNNSNDSPLLTTQLEILKNDVKTLMEECAVLRAGIDKVMDPTIIARQVANESASAS
eukprot:PhF_6_TR5184/c0_g1_i4/m.7453